jgi:hypothetical protein
VRSLFPSSEGMAGRRARSTARALHAIPAHAKPLSSGLGNRWGTQRVSCWLGNLAYARCPIVAARPCSASVPLPSSIFVGVDVTAPRTHRPNCLLSQLCSLRFPPRPIALHGGCRALTHDQLSLQGWTSILKPPGSSFTTPRVLSSTDPGPTATATIRNFRQHTGAPIC